MQLRDIHTIVHNINCCFGWYIFIILKERKQASKKEEWARKQQQKMKQQLKVEID